MTYEPPRVTFVGSDPKIPAFRKAARRVANLAGPFYRANGGLTRRFVNLWHVSNRRTRVLMERVRRVNAT